MNHNTESLDELVPLALLAAELETPVAELAQRIADDVVRDDIGLRAVPVAAARAVLAEHHDNAERRAAAAARAEREAAMLAEHAPVRVRVPQTLVYTDPYETGGSLSAGVKPNSSLADLEAAYARIEADDDMGEELRDTTLASLADMIRDYGRPAPKPEVCGLSWNGSTDAERVAFEKQRARTRSYR